MNEPNFDPSTIQSVEHTALYILGESDPSTTTRHRKATLFRQAIQQGQTHAFEVTQYNMGMLATVVGAAQICSVFQGKSAMFLDGQALEPEGFFKAFEGVETFHPDSVEFEEAFDTALRSALFTTKHLMGEGVNPSQAASFWPMGIGTSAALSGSVLDYFRLYRAVSNRAKNFDPSAVICVTDMWAKLSTEFPVLSEVIREVAE